MFLPRANPLKVIGRFTAILTEDGLRPKLPTGAAIGYLTAIRCLQLFEPGSAPRARATVRFPRQPPDHTAADEAGSAPTVEPVGPEIPDRRDGRTVRPFDVNRTWGRSRDPCRKRKVGIEPMGRVDRSTGSHLGGAVRFRSPWQGTYERPLPNQRLKRGNTVGEHPLRARCSPWSGLRRGFVRSTNATRARRVHRATARHRAGYRPRSLGGALCRPPGAATVRAGANSNPWRERPPEMAARPAKPAASDVVAHATAERVLAPRAGTVSPPEVALNSTRNLTEN